MGALCLVAAAALVGLHCWVWGKANAELVAWLVVCPWQTELVAYWLVVEFWFWADLVAY